jgi:hypothetical protein
LLEKWRLFNLIIINRLENPEKIEEYKEWLASKSLHYLKCLTHIFKMDENRKERMYPNLLLRMELLDNVIKRKTQ